MSRKLPEKGMTFKAEWLPQPCTFCGKPIGFAGEFGGIVHNYECQEFMSMEPHEFLSAHRRKLGIKTPWDAEDAKKLN